MRQRVFVSALLLGGLFQLSAPSALAQTRADCLTCHSDSTLSKEGPGNKTISLFADESILNKSMHAKLECVACHVGFKPDDLPHKAQIEPVACQRCHTEIGQQYQKSTHGQLKAKHDNNAPTCQLCHGTHGVLGKRDPKSASFPTHIPTLCAQCHRLSLIHISEPTRLG